MLRTSLIGAVVLIGLGSSVLADPKQDVLAAANKLAESDNYSWTSTVQGGVGGGMGFGMGSGGAEGKVQRDGLTMLVLSLRDAEVQAFFKGGKGAFQTPDGQWQSIEEAADQRGPGMMIANMVRVHQPPAAQARTLAEKAQDLKKTEEGGYTGTLSAEDATALLQRRGGRGMAPGAGAGAGPGAGQGAPDVKDAAGTVTFWTDDSGALNKLQLNLRGRMTIRGEERDIDRTTTIEIRDVGTTEIDIPDEAKAKMES